jgi:hypothetical protein
MPNPKLSDRYKGKSFGEIATEIESKYKDRHDPISRRGLMAEMQSLRNEQEYQKQKQQITEQLNQTIQQFQQPNQQQVQEQPLMITQDSNQGIQLPPMEEDQGQFQHASSQTYNQKFGYGGNMDYAFGGNFNDDDPGMGTLGNANNPMLQNDFSRGILQSDGVRPPFQLPPTNNNNPLLNVFDSREKEKWVTASDPDIFRENAFANRRYNFGVQWHNTRKGLGIDTDPNNFAWHSIYDQEKISQTPKRTSQLTPEQIAGREMAFQPVQRQQQLTPKPTTQRKATSAPTRTNVDLDTLPTALSTAARALPEFSFNSLAGIQSPDIVGSTKAAIAAQQNQALLNQNQNNNELQRSNLNAMRYAPLLSNLFNIFSARRPDSTQAELSKMGFRDKVDESLAGNVIPRQTQFQNIDMSQIERGIQNQARNFTGSNINVSGGNAGQFLSNELANQSNIMNAIGQARMQAQMQDRQIDGMNAQEQARIDQFNQSQQMQKADLQRFNIGMGLQMADLDARNEGAFLSNRAANIMGLGTNIGNIGREEDMMKMIANTMGYDSFGQYVANLRPEDRKKVETSVRKQLFGGIFKSRKKSK